ncbi:Uncharacterised protein [Mycobacteroides abscessus subsp. abscessus]|nr:Uncharacterised protein [Mycobacteroides abscessus subsp. abscessus]
MVASWIIRTTRPPSITVHTASSSAQLGRVSVLPPTASLPFAPLAPTQSDICGSSPVCTRTTDATCRPLRERDVLSAPALRELLVKRSTIDLQDIRPGDTRP